VVGRAEIDIDASDLVAFKDETLGIAKALSVPGRALIGHKGRIAFDQNPFEILPFDPVAGLPAPREIGRLVDAVVIGTGETEIVGEGRFDGLAIVRPVGRKQGADDLRLA